MARRAASRADAPLEHVSSPLPPYVDAGSRVLLLGSMPSPKSREAGFHYGNPQNRFWRVIAALWDEEPPATMDERRGLLSRHHLALHDVLASCDIRGASDASIENPVPADVASLLDAAPIARIFCTGSAAARLFKRYQEPLLGVGCIRLPSTSPANAAWGLERLVGAYGVVREAAEGEAPAIRWDRAGELADAAHVRPGGPHGRP